VAPEGQGGSQTEHAKENGQKAASAKPRALKPAKQQHQQVTTTHEP